MRKFVFRCDWSDHLQKMEPIAPGNISLAVIFRIGKFDNAYIWTLFRFILDGLFEQGANSTARAGKEPVRWISSFSSSNFFLSRVSGT